MKKVESRYLNIILAVSCLLISSSEVLGQNISAQETKAKDTKATDAQKVVETPIENVMAVTTDQLVGKPEEYLNKNVKFTAPFFAFSNLALDYKPAFRSSRTYLSFLVLRTNSHTPFSEIKLAMLIPKEKDPQTKMLQTLKEGDIVEITGHVFASSLDEPWLDVLKLKKIASAKKNDNAEDKASDDKESSSEDQSSEK
jgi:lysyl-tRNA synthetase class II